MTSIRQFPFDADKFDQLKSYHFGRNWPIVYILEDGKEMYVGETINVHNRSKDHYKKENRKKLRNIHVLADDEFNKSATLDIESWIIQYMSADGLYSLQNGNGGLKDHNYYDREKYKAKFELIWEELRTLKLARSKLVDIRNTDLFKYSPYKALTEDQFLVTEEIVKAISSQNSSTSIVSGKPGTGKTIVATYLVKYLLENEDTMGLSIALVIPMTSLRKTLRKVFRAIRGLKSSMVIGPNDVTKQHYDVLIVDEAHRLKRRKNITNYKSFDDTNKKLGFGHEGTELDWILQSSQHQVFFYDENQSVRPADLPPEYFKNISSHSYSLVTQMRVEGGSEYIQMIDDIFDQTNHSKKDIAEYEFTLHSNINDMHALIQTKDREMGLCRMVAGYAWEWATKTTKTGYDIDIDGLQMTWNTTNQDWVNSPNAVNEVGCIHTVQGYDLNYVGVIIGAELSYDFTIKDFVINRKEYKDKNGFRGVDDDNELKRYIINIYKTLLTRGIKGTHLYIVDERLRKYFKQYLN